MPRPLSEPDNERGKELLRLLKAIDPALTIAAKRIGVGFDVLYKLLHIPSYQPREKTAQRIAQKLGIPLEKVQGHRLAG